MQNSAGAELPCGPVCGTETGAAAHLATTGKHQPQIIRVVNIPGNQVTQLLRGDVGVIRAQQGGGVLAPVQDHFAFRVAHKRDWVREGVVQVACDCTVYGGHVRH
jgi:hypothetical protein